MAGVVDKRFLHDGTTHETPHMSANEFLPECIHHLASANDSALEV